MSECTIVAMSAGHIISWIGQDTSAYIFILHILYTLYYIFYALHSRCHLLSTVFHTRCSIPYALQPMFYGLRSMFSILFSILCTLVSTFHILQFTNCIYSEIYIPYSTVTLYSMIWTRHSIFDALQYMLCIFYILYALYSIFHMLYFRLYIHYSLPFTSRARLCLSEEHMPECTVVAISAAHIRSRMG